MKDTLKYREENKKLLSLYLEGKLKDNQLQKFLDFLQTREGQELLKQDMDSDSFSITNTSLPAKQSDKIYKQINRRIKHTQNHFSFIIKIAATFLLLVSLGTGVYFISPLQNRFAASMVEVTEGQQEITLPDGTHVRLNKGSHLSYSSGMMKKKKREVILLGEAFFEVAKNPEKPFIINADKAEIKVLGTMFNVKTGQKSNTTVVAVQEGRVLFSNKKQKKSVILTANEVGILEAGETIRKVSQPAQNYFSWFEHYLEFENMPLPQVVKQLETIFDTSIKLTDPDLNNKYFTAYMHGTSVDEVMTQLALSMELKLEKTNGKYFLKK
ncbi:FecR family protein [Maribellus comscasis]|nr:FecR family protein [Maribellus comscasis]